MMLLTHGYGAPVGYGADLGGAAKTLARWRELVARWAQSPSGPMSRRYADAVTAAFAANLDTAAALREMAALADDPGEPDGVKFETFAAADMLLGLDLARDVGKLFPRNEWLVSGRKTQRINVRTHDHVMSSRQVSSLPLTP